MGQHVEPCFIDVFSIVAIVSTTFLEGYILLLKRTICVTMWDFSTGIRKLITGLHNGKNIRICIVTADSGQENISLKPIEHT